MARLRRSQHSDSCSVAALFVAVLVTAPAKSAIVRDGGDSNAQIENPIVRFDLAQDLGLSERSRPQNEIEFTPLGDYLIVGSRVIDTESWQVCPLETKGRFVTTSWPNRVVYHSPDDAALFVTDLSFPDSEPVVIPDVPVYPRRICAAREHPWIIAVERVPNSPMGTYQLLQYDLEKGTSQVKSRFSMGAGTSLVFNISLMANDRFVLVLSQQAIYIYDLSDEVWVTSPDLENALTNKDPWHVTGDHHIARMHWIHGSHFDTTFFVAVRGTSNLECHWDREAMKLRFGYLGEFDVQPTDNANTLDANEPRREFQYSPTVADSRCQQIASLNQDRWLVTQRHHFALRVENSYSVSIVDRESNEVIAWFSNSIRGSLVRMPFACSERKAIVAIMNSDHVLSVWSVSTLEEMGQRRKKEAAEREAHQTRQREEKLRQLRRERLRIEASRTLLNALAIIIETDWKWRFSRVSLIKETVSESLRLLARRRQ